MKKTNALKRIEKEIKRLSAQDQLRLVEKLAILLRQSGIDAKKEKDWRALYGLGKGLWEEQEVQDYVSGLRDERI